ncbi:MAG: hypothetical protein ACLQT5_08320 [Steroidobacteraceae bacterium]|jgi:hypothetical protein
MTDAKLRTLALGTLLGLALAAHGQQATDSANSQPSTPAATAAPTSAPAAAPATPGASTTPGASATPAEPASTAPPVVVVHTNTSMATSVSSAAPAAPPADLVKDARNAGYHTKTKNGVTQFCKYDADVGTRFKTEKCFNQDTMADILNRDQLQRDQLGHMGCSGGGSCGGSK